MHNIVLNRFASRIEHRLQKLWEEEQTLPKGAVWGSCCKNSTPSVMRALYIAEFCHQIIALFRALRVQPRQTAVFGFNTDVFKIMRFVNKYRVDPEVIEKNSGRAESA